MKPFGPLVFVARKLLGETQFVTVRTWAIKNHVAVINKFSDLVKLNKKGRQNLILLAKRNGKLSGLNN